MVAGPCNGKIRAEYQTQGLGHRMDFLSTGSLVPFHETGVHGGAVRRSQELSHQNQVSEGVRTACFLAGPFPKARPGTRAALADAQGCLWKGDLNLNFPLVPHPPSCHLTYLISTDVTTFQTPGPESWPLTSYRQVPGPRCLCTARKQLLQVPA